MNNSNEFSENEKSYIRQMSSFTEGQILRHALIGDLIQKVIMCALFVFAWKTDDLALLIMGCLVALGTSIYYRYQVANSGTGYLIEICKKLLKDMK